MHRIYLKKAKWLFLLIKEVKKSTKIVGILSAPNKTKKQMF